MELAGASEKLITLVDEASAVASAVAAAKGAETSTWFARAVSPPGFADRGFSRLRQQRKYDRHEEDRARRYTEALINTDRLQSNFQEAVAEVLQVASDEKNADVAIMAAMRFACGYEAWLDLDDDPQHWGAMLEESGLLPDVLAEFGLEQTPSAVQVDENSSYDWVTETLEELPMDALEFVTVHPFAVGDRLALSVVLGSSGTTHVFAPADTHQNGMEFAHIGCFFGGDIANYQSLSAPMLDPSSALHLKFCDAYLGTADARSAVFDHYLAGVSEAEALARIVKSVAVRATHAPDSWTGESKERVACRYLAAEIADELGDSSDVPVDQIESMLFSTYFRAVEQIMQMHGAWEGAR